ncbi:MAG: hypothetical protein GY827_10095 [Cytophagales bacterium]|nr:hypothetical protein [Cytophagales bacterium]
MKKAVLLSLLVFFSISGFSQLVSDTHLGKVYWGKEFKQARTGFSQLLGEDKKHFYTINNWEEIVVLDTNLNFVSAHPIQFSDAKKLRYFELEKVLFLNKEIIFITSGYNFRNKEIVIQKHTLSTSALHKKATSSRISSFKADKKQAKLNQLYVEVSQDSTHYLLYHNLSTEKKEDNESFFAIITNSSLQKKWDKQIEVPYSSKLFTIEQIKLDNKGGLHILGINFFGKVKTKVKGKPNYHYRILSYTAQGEKDFEIALEDKFITDMNIISNAYGNLIGVGLYSSEGTSSIKGSFYLKINHRSQKIVIHKIFPFGYDILQNYLSEQKIATGGEIMLYNLDQIILHKDGGLSFSAEQHYRNQKVYSQLNPSGGAINYTVDFFHHNDVLVFRHDISGELLWTSLLKKTQATSNDGGYYSSYQLLPQKDKLYLLFNDHPDNYLPVEEEEEERSFVFHNEPGATCLSVASIDTKGNIHYKKLLNHHEIGLNISPASIQQFDDNQILLVGVKRRKQRFGKLKLSPQTQD